MITFSKTQPLFKWIVESLLITFILGFSALIVLQQANPMLSNLGRDAGAFAYIGNQIAHGQIPYLDAWDSKPPGVFLVNAFGLSIIKGSRWGIWVVEYLFLGLSTLFNFLSLRKIFGLGSALFASLVWHYGLYRTLIGGNFTEEFSLLFGFLSMLLFVKSLDMETTWWADLGIGICAGSGFLFRLNNIGPQVTVILTISILLLTRKKYLLLLKRLVTIAAAAFIPIGLLSLYLIPKNAFGAFWEASFLYNLAYSGNHFNPASSLSSGLTHIGWPAGITLLGVIMTWLELGTNVIKKKEDVNPVILWISLSAIIEILLSGISGRNYIHYFINWMVLVSFASAFIISRSFSSFLEWINKNSSTFLAVSAILFFLYFNKVPGIFYESVLPLLSHSEITETEDPIAYYLSMKTSSGQTVLVWGGQAGVNFLAKRDSPTPYLFYPLYVESEITNRISKDFYDKLISNPPKYIVDGSAYDFNHTLIPLNLTNPQRWLKEYGVYNTPYLLETLGFIQEHYTLAQTIKNVDIYRLR